jgi:hypothetical protein
MTNFIKEYKNLNDDEFFNIKKQFEECTDDFEDSMMYSQKTEEKFIDKNIRLSKFRTMKTDNIFKSFDVLVGEINKRDKLQKFRLIRNDITHIKYEKDGYFKKHDDFQSIKSNIVTEYTMILCLDSECEGGRTLFHFNDHFKYFSSASVTNGNVVIFRKDIHHEGEIIKSGHKEILTANLLCTDILSEKIVLVSFLNDERKYVINYNYICSIKDCVISVYIDFNIKNGNIDENDNIYEYKSEFSTYEEFQIIYKIFMKEYITIDEYNQNTQLLDYHNIHPSNIFIEIINEMIKKSEYKDEIIVSDGITMFQNRDQMKYARSFLNYSNSNTIPMKFYFAEGTYNFGGGMEDEPSKNIKMTPIFVSVGDYDNILFMRGLKTTHFIELQLEEIIKESHEYDEITNKLKLNPNKEFTLCEDDGDESDNFVTPSKINSVENINEIYDLKIALDECFFGECEYLFPGLKYSLKYKNQDIVELMFGEEYDRSYGICKKYIFDKHEELKEERKLFNLDINNKMFFTEQQRELIFEKIINKNIIENIRKSLMDVKLRLQQQKASVDHNFCNESIYGEFTIIEINCIVDLEV